jgi:hypothetical protein
MNYAKGVVLFGMLFVLITCWLPASALADQGTQSAPKGITVSADLKTVTINGDSGHVVRILNTPDSRTANFNADFARHGLTDHIGSCARVISIAAGAAHGNTSYGGLCSLDGSNKRTVAVCDDEMVGHFHTVDVDAQNFSSRQLIEFVASNCWGG